MSGYVYTPTEFMAENSYYDKAAADRAVNFIQKLCHTKGEWAGQRFRLMHWQEKIVRDVFGTKRADGRRQFRTIYCELPKKSGKSELAAAIALYCLCADNEPKAEVYSAGVELNQARIVFNVAVDMMAQWPVLSRRCKLYKSAKEIHYLPLGGVYKALSADAAGKHGFSPSCVVVDEVHAHKDRTLIDNLLRGSGRARRQPLFFCITTAGDSRETICWEMHSKALDIIAGNLSDPSFYPCVYYAPDDADWTDPAVWAKANPSLGIIATLEDFHIDCESAKSNPAEEQKFRQLTLNQWLGSTTKWLPTAVWDACDFPVDPEALYGRKCYAGVDLSSTTDITALVLVFPPVKEDGRYDILPFFWLPEDTIPLRVRRDHVQYDVWKARGLFYTTPGDVIDTRFIRKTIEGLSEVYGIEEIAFDPWKATHIMQELDDEGFTVFPIRQGMKSLAPAMDELERLLLKKQLAHGGNPVLRWMFDNMNVKADENGNVRPVKDKKSEKIDGMLALIMALYRAVMSIGEAPSVYDKGGRGLIVF